MKLELEDLYLWRGDDVSFWGCDDVKLRSGICLNQRHTYLDYYKYSYTESWSQ